MYLAAAALFVLEQADLGGLTGFHERFEIAACGGKEFQTPVHVLNRLATTQGRCFDLGEDRETTGFP
jgi:hypothetical protein